MRKRSHRFDPSSRSDRDLTSQLRGLVKSQATLVDVTPSLAELADDLREEFGLKTWDAIHLATSVLTEADVPFVRDGKFPTGRLVRGVWVSTPYDIEGEHLFNSDIDQENL